MYMFIENLDYFKQLRSINIDMLSKQKNENFLLQFEQIEEKIKRVIKNK